MVKKGKHGKRYFFFLNLAYINQSLFKWFDKKKQKKIKIKTEQLILVNGAPGNTAGQYRYTKYF